MIRTRSQMENEPHEKVFQEDRMIKRAHRLTSLRTLHKDETRKKLPGSVHGERANFGGLVLGCIDSYDSESRRIFQHFSRSTRLAYLCTAQTSKFLKKISYNFAKLKIEIQSKFQIFFMKNAISHRNFDEILSGFREHVPKCLNSLKIPEIVQNFDEKSAKFPEFVKI